MSNLFTLLIYDTIRIVKDIKVVVKLVTMSSQRLLKLVRVQTNQIMKYIYLPREFCRRLHLDRGAVLMATLEDGAIILRPVEIQVKKPKR